MIVQINGARICSSYNFYRYSHRVNWVGPFDENAQGLYFYGHEIPVIIILCSVRVGVYSGDLFVYLY